MFCLPVAELQQSGLSWEGGWHLNTLCTGPWMCRCEGAVTGSLKSCLSGCPVGWLSPSHTETRIEPPEASVYCKTYFSCFWIQFTLIKCTRYLSNRCLCFFTLTCHLLTGIYMGKCIDEINGMAAPNPFPCFI